MTKEPDGTNKDDIDDHDRGLAFDLQTLLMRRRTLALLGVAGVGAFFAVRQFGVAVGGEVNVTGVGADGAVCLKDPAETAGPYPGDGTNQKSGATVNALADSGIVRQDLRTSFAGMEPVAEGVPVTLEIALVDVAAGCKPLAGHALYLWHCDAEGRYSLYDTTDRNYLRGVGISDAEGKVRFTTIFPGCYDGRWPHMHFEVFADQASASTGKNSLLTSQFALPGDLAAAVYAAVPLYQASVANLARVSLAQDMVFRDNTTEQVAAQTLNLSGDVSQGFTATGVIGVALG